MEDTNSIVLSTRDNLTVNTLSNLQQRNLNARAAIKRYADLHAGIDVAIGAAGFFGLAIPALIGAIALQSPVIYQPLSRELATIYNKQTDAETGAIITENVVFTGAADIAAEFSVEFIGSVAGELVAEAGLGATAGFIPLIGGVIGAALDYVIATAMTWRVGTMTSMYFQNGGQWIRNRQHTYELAKQMTGGFEFGLSDLVGRFSGVRRPSLDVDLNQVTSNVPEIFENQVRSLKPIIAMLLKMGGIPQVRELLRQRGIPAPVIDAAFRVANVATAG